MVTANFPIFNTGRTHSYFPQPHKESRDDAAENVSPGRVNRFPSARQVKQSQRSTNLSALARLCDLCSPKWNK